MNAIDIFKQLIGNRIEPLIIRYNPYEDVFATHPYRHTFDLNFENDFVDILFDSIIFYAYEKDEIENKYERGRLSDLRKASRMAYENRLPKTERLNDGIMGELALDIFIKLFYPNIEMLYSRAKYIEKLPRKEQIPSRNGQEIKGYDGMVFSIENGQKYFWVGQVKTGSWKYCFDDIKEDINKSIIKYYFSDAIAIMCDVMCAVNNVSQPLQNIINDINDIICDSNGDREIKTQGILDYFNKENIIVRIPCLLMPEESKYNDSEALLDNIKRKVYDAFKDFKIVNEGNLDIEIVLLVFPIRDLKTIRRLFLEVRKK